MKNKWLLFACLPFIWGYLLSKESAVTYEGGGRFGDKLSVYCKAKWISYKYKIPLYYKPFDQSDGLVLHNIERLYSDHIKKKFKKVITLNQDSKINIEPHKGYFYIIEFHAEVPVDWNDQGFITELKKVLKPRDAIKELLLPKDCITVAVHVRKGSAHDAPLLTDNKNINFSRLPRALYSDVKWPTKFPPDSYYIEQLKKITEIFKDQKIYAFIFTDNGNPEAIVQKYKDELKNDNILLDCHKIKKLYVERVIDDFFALSKFDCLIRSSSRFSLIAGKLGNYKVQICPKSYHWEGNTLIIDEADIESNL